MGIEPTSSAWKAVALPLSYARILQTIYEMFLSQARQFVPVLIPRRHAALAASRLYRDMVGNSRQPGNHLLANPGFFSLSRSSATSVPFNLHGDPPNLEFSRHAACHESTEVMPGIRIRNCLAVRHDGKPRPHGVFDKSRQRDHVMDRPAPGLTSNLMVKAAGCRHRRPAVSRILANHVSVQVIPHCRGPDGCGCRPLHQHPRSAQRGAQVRQAVISLS